MLGQMTKFASIVRKQRGRDTEGFNFDYFEVLANIRVFVEERHASEFWANLSTFSEATNLFQFRRIPNLKVTTNHYIYYDNEYYNILSAENVKGRGMYIEVLAKKVVPSNGQV